MMINKILKYVLFYQYTSHPPDDQYPRIFKVVLLVKYVALLLCSESRSYSFTDSIVLLNKGKMGLLCWLKAVAVYLFHYSERGFAGYGRSYIVISVSASRIIVALRSFAKFVYSPPNDLLVATAYAADCFPNNSLYLHLFMRLVAVLLWWPSTASSRYNHTTRGSRSPYFVTSSQQY